MNISVIFIGRKASESISKTIFLASPLATTILPPPMDVAASCHFLSMGSRVLFLALAALAAAFLEAAVVAAAAAAPRGGTGEGVTPLVSALADLLLLPPFLDLAPPPAAVVTSPLPGGGVTAPPPAPAPAAAADAAAGGAGGSALVGSSARTSEATRAASPLFKPAAPSLHLSMMRARWVLVMELMGRSPLEGSGKPPNQPS